MIKWVLLFIAFIALALSACSPERILARKYLENHANNAIMIVPAYDLYKDNLVLDYDTTIKYTPSQLDSMAWAQSTFVRFLSDSIFLTNFTNSFIDGLNRYGYDVYIENDADVFLGLPDPKWMINLAQIQLTEEYTYEYRTAYYMEDYYTIKFRKNKVNLSTWLEASKANSENMDVLYLEGYLEDRIVNPLDLGLLFSYNLAPERDSISLRNVYTMASQSGSKHAELLFDYFMNDYIRKNLPADAIPTRLYHYNWNNKKLTGRIKQKFEIMEK